MTDTAERGKGPDATDVEAPRTEIHQTNGGDESAALESQTTKRTPYADGAEAKVARNLEAFGLEPTDRISVCSQPYGGDFIPRIMTVTASPSVVASLGLDRCVWVGQTPLRHDLTSGRGKAADVIGLTQLWTELDDDKIDRADQLTIIDQLTSILGTPPSVIVGSGHGLHPHWLMDPEDPATRFAAGSAESHRAAHLLKGFGQLVEQVAHEVTGAPAGVKLVDNVHELARVLRVDGTMNVKVPGAHVPTTATYPAGGAVTFDDVEEILETYGVAIEVSASREARPHETYTGPAYSELSPQHAAMADRFVDSVFARIAAEFAEAKGLEDHQEDSKGRTWQKIMSDGAYDTGALATVWSGLSEDDVVERLMGMVPEEMEGAEFSGGVSVLATVKKQVCRKAKLPAPDNLTNALAVEQLKESKAASETVATPAAPALDTYQLFAGNDFSDANAPDAFALWVVDRARYVPKTKQWLRWEGVRWEPIDDPAIVELSRIFAQRLVEDVAKLQRADISKAAASRQSKGRVEGVVGLATGHDLLRVDADELDADPHLLNCPNGVVDLRTKELLPHDPDRLMTKVTGANYVPGATHPDWEKVLSDLEPDVADHLQILAGQAITGDRPEDDRATVLQGPGANSKTTMMLACMKAVGDRKGKGYARLISGRVLVTDGRGNQHPTEITELMGARLAVLEELPNGGELSMERLKKITGAVIEARRIAADSIEWSATHSLFLTTNDLPRVRETDGGSWRRLRMIHFPIRYVKTKAELQAPNTKPRDPMLRWRLQNLQPQREAVLAWLVDGAHRYYQLGRELPEDPATIAATTKDWRLQTNPLGRFLEDNVEAGHGWCIPSDELWKRFKAWLPEEGMAGWSNQTFGARLKDQDLFTSGHVVKGKPRVSTGEHESRPQVSYHPDQEDVKHLWADGQQVNAYVGMKWRDDLPSGGD